MKDRLDRYTIAARAVKEFKNGDYVNLGIGIPTLCSLYIPTDKTVFYHAELGVLGYGHLLMEDEVDKMDYDLINASGEFVAPQPGMSFFDHGLSFLMVWGGHLNISVLGAFEVSERGDLANWARKRGAKWGAIGGSMDMAKGARRTIVCMEHTTKNGEPKIVKSCQYPLTAKECVQMIITDIAVIEITNQGLLLKEVAPGWTAGDVQDCTQPRLHIASDLKEIEL